VLVTRCSLRMLRTKRRCLRWVIALRSAAAVEYHLIWCHQSPAQQCTGTGLCGLNMQSVQYARDWLKNFRIFTVQKTVQFFARRRIVRVFVVSETMHVCIVTALCSWHMSSPMILSDSCIWTLFYVNVNHAFPHSQSGRLWINNWIYNIYKFTYDRNIIISDAVRVINFQSSQEINIEHAH